VRKFKDTPVPDEVIQEMLEMARLAPSGGNRQGWVFGVVRDADEMPGLKALKSMEKISFYDRWGD
jgi:nitroreductase